MRFADIDWVVHSRAAAFISGKGKHLTLSGIGYVQNSELSRSKLLGFAFGAEEFFACLLRHWVVFQLCPVQARIY